MDAEQFTEKANEALGRAQRIALEGSAPEIFPVHLALALLADDSGVAKQLIAKAGGDVGEALTRLKQLIVLLRVLFVFLTSFVDSCS